MKSLCLLHNPFRRKHFLSPKPEPGIAAPALVQIFQFRSFALIRHVEEIPQRLHPVSLLSVSQQLTHRQIQILSQQIQKGALNGPLRLHHEFQLADVQCLDSLSVVLSCPFAGLVNAVQNFAVFSNGLSHHQGNTALQRLTGIIPSVNLSDSRVSGTVFYDHQISCEKRGVSSAQCHQHAVTSRHRNHLHLRH